MALVTRISRLFRADMHAVLDRLEEPDVLLKQAVREMHDALSRDEQRLRLMRHERRQLETRTTELTDSLQQIKGELDLCFASAEESLARKLVKRRLEAQRLHKLLNRRIESLTNECSDLDSRINDNRATLHDMQQKLDLLDQENQSADGVSSFDTGYEINVRDDEVELAFLREKRERQKS